MGIEDEKNLNDEEKRKSELQTDLRNILEGLSRELDGVSASVNSREYSLEELESLYEKVKKLEEFSDDLDL
ncbi:MAG: hypothetical protein NT170_04795 [Candidatus Moranbacteria bacterium]|nr:hypothetical protein [Candidatus Moranbacteria bacterium]